MADKYMEDEGKRQMKRLGPGKQQAVTGTLLARDWKTLDTLRERKPERKKVARKR